MLNLLKKITMRTVFVILLFITPLFALNPHHKYQLDSAVIDMILKDKSLYASTASGRIERINIETKEKTTLLKLEPLINFFDEKYDAKIYSVDLNSRGELLILAEASEGRRRVLLLKGNELKELSQKECKAPYKEARFVDDENILLVTLANEVSLLNIKSRKKLYTKHLSNYTFSDFALNNNIAAITGESGDIYLFDYKKHKVLKVLSGANKDNIYSIDYKDDTVLTAGQDRNVGIYNVTTEKYKRIKTDFLVYACALSHDGKISAYLSSEESDITVLENSTLKSLAKLSGHKSTVNRIIFASKSHIFSSADDGQILEWKISK